MLPKMIFVLQIKLACCFAEFIVICLFTAVCDVEFSKFQTVLHKRVKRERQDINNSQNQSFLCILQQDERHSLFKNELCIVHVDQVSKLTRMQVKPIGMWLQCENLFLSNSDHVSQESRDFTGINMPSSTRWRQTNTNLSRIKADEKKAYQRDVLHFV